MRRLTQLGLATLSILGLLVAGGGCAHAADLFQQLQGSVLMKDLQAAQTNLNNAVSNGDLPPDDPAAACLNGVLGSLATKPDAKPYAVSGVVSFGTIGYIDLHKAGKIQGAADSSCQQLLGQFVINGIRQITPMRLP